MNMKFQMGADTLTAHTKQTANAGDELTALVRELAQSAEPLEGQFRGAARVAFDDFKAKTDEIAVELGSSLNAMLEGIGSMNTAFLQGEQTQVDEISAAKGSSSFDAARFGARA